MIQDDFAGAEQIGATLDVLAAALLDGRATHYPVASLTGFRRDAHQSASALFGLRLSPNGPGTLTVRGLGTVVAGSTADPSAPDAAVAAELLSRFGGGAVRGVFASAHGLDAGQFQLPVGADRTDDEKLRPSFPAVLAELAADRQTVAPEELSTGSGVEIRLVVPSVFHALAVRGATPARTAQLAEVAEEIFAGGDLRTRKEWAVLTGALAQPLGTAGVLFAGVAALRVSERPSHASLVVSLTHRPVQVSELATQLADSRPHAEVWTVLLPSGPAAVLVEGRTSPVPPALSSDGQPYRTSSSVAQAFVPLPDGASVLAVQLSVAQPEDWELYMAAFADVLKSIQLGWDGVYGAQLPIPVQTQSPTDPYAAAAPAVPAPTDPYAAAAQTAPATDPYTAAPAQSQSQSPQPVIPPQPTSAPPIPSAPPVPPAAPAAPPVAVSVAAAEQSAPKGTPVTVPPADFNPFAPPSASVPAQSAAPAEEARPLKGTPVQVPPADFNPFAPPAPSAAAPAAAAPAPGKGTAVQVPPADFDPFAPPAPSTAPAANASAPGKGTPVQVPPADFNPFGTPASPAPVPAAPAAAPAPQPAQSADPFGTVMNNEPTDPFGTVTTGSSPARAAAAPAPAPTFAAPPPPSAPPTVPAPGKGTPVHVPPADFNPFAPPAPSTAPAAEAPAATEAPAPGKGTPVQVPPADFNPFAPPAPSTAPAANAPAPATPEPPANYPFG
ncbi:hypothetical protein [Kitasatospora sp. GP82]|uniref:hypothetical protein n=1 Tax=Kitasatospora sp. GP82 TaxID=3035089 RepID=UPI0024748859|nr:hypothetical protein [Kitasatospora sp. GP82]MDH6124678.1 hypothetical protein [Kitasatospora sp. GP82]